MSIFTKKKAYDFFIYGFGQVINLASPLLIFPFIISTCGEEGLGKVGIGFSLALLLTAIIDYGSYIIGVREIAINRENQKLLNQKVNAIYGSKIILLLIVLLFSFLIIYTVPFFTREKELFLLSLIIVIGQFVNPSWFFQGVENYKWISFINIVSKIIYLASVFFFVKQSTDYIYVNLFYGIGLFVSSSIGFIWLIKKFNFSINFNELKKGKTIIKEEFSFSVSQVFLSAHQYLPIMIVSFVLGDFVAGQFRVIDQIISLFKTYLNMIFYFVYANICHELNKNFKKGFKMWKQYNGLNLILMICAIIFFYIFSSPIFSYFNLSVSVEHNLTALLQIGLVIPLLLAFSQPLKQLLFAFDKNKFYVRITIFITVLNIVLMFIFTKHFQLYGTILTTIFCEFLVLILYFYTLKDTLRE